MPLGFMYLVAIMDWFSRYVVARQLSNTRGGAFCLEALRLALRHGQPDIFNTDQGVQFTAHDFTDELEKVKIRVSMDGRGRVFDNIFIERLWRTVKYEEIYIRGVRFGAGPWSTAYKITSSYTITSDRTKASATKCPLTFIMLLRHQFNDPMIHLNFVDLWS